MDVDAQVGLSLDVGLQVGHLEVVIYPVDNKVGEPRVLSRSFEKLIEELKALLPEVVTKELEAHEG